MDHCTHYRNLTLQPISHFSRVYFWDQNRHEWGHWAARVKECCLLILTLFLAIIPYAEYPHQQCMCCTLVSFCLINYRIQNDLLGI